MLQQQVEMQQQQNTMLHGQNTLLLQNQAMTLLQNQATILQLLQQTKGADQGQVPAVALAPSQHRYQDEHQQPQQDEAPGSGSELLLPAQQPAGTTWDATVLVHSDQLQPAVLRTWPPEHSAAAEQGQTWGRGFTAESRVITV